MHFWIIDNNFTGTVPMEFAGLSSSLETLAAGGQHIVGGKLGRDIL
jgi:hypothetical protein